jgi:hypothetical protein
MTESDGKVKVYKPKAKYGISFFTPYNTSGKSWEGFLAATSDCCFVTYASYQTGTVCLPPRLVIVLDGDTSLGQGTSNPGQRCLHWSLFLKDGISLYPQEFLSILQTWFNTAFKPCKMTGAAEPISYDFNCSKMNGIARSYDTFRCNLFISFY